MGGWSKKWLKTDGNCCGAMEMCSVDWKHATTIENDFERPKMCDNGRKQVLAGTGCWKHAVGRSGQVVFVDNRQKRLLVVVNGCERLVLARKRVLVALVSVYWYCLCFRMLCLSCKLLLYLILVCAGPAGSKSLGTWKCPKKAGGSVRLETVLLAVLEKQNLVESSCECLCCHQMG